MRKVPCPRCGQLTEFSKDNPYRPFCSERCQLIDLGQWASEAYKVPEESQTEVSDYSSSELSAEEESED